MFRAEENGERLTFRLSGLVGANFVMRDAQTGTTWQQATGEAIAGQLQGRRLALEPFVLTSWSEWREQHPAALVLAPEPAHQQEYARMRLVIEGAGFGLAGDEQRALHHDKRLPDRAMVVGLEQGRTHKAYPLKLLAEEKVVNDVLGSEPVLLVYRPGSQTTTAFVRRLRGRTLELRASDAGVKELIDRETGSRWNVYGQCIAGKLRGSRLEELVPEGTFWYAWAEFHPDTGVYSGKAVEPSGR